MPTFESVLKFIKHNDDVVVAEANKLQTIWCGEQAHISRPPQHNHVGDILEILTTLPHHMITNFNVCDGNKLLPTNTRTYAAYDPNMMTACLRGLKNVKILSWGLFRRPLSVPRNYQTRCYFRFVERFGDFGFMVLKFDLNLK